MRESKEIRKMLEEHHDRINQHLYDMDMKAYSWEEWLFHRLEEALDKLDDIQKQINIPRWTKNDMGDDIHISGQERYEEIEKIMEDYSGW